MPCLGKFPTVQYEDDMSGECDFIFRGIFGKENTNKQSSQIQRPVQQIQPFVPPPMSHYTHDSQYSTWKENDIQAM